MIKKIVPSFLLFLLVLPQVSLGQTAKQADVWQPFAFMIGEWKGQGGGEPGMGNYERSYRFIYNKNFIEARNKSVYPPSKENPKGEVHEDLGYISYDKARKTYVLRQFHIEGFFNQYRLESMAPDGSKFVFVSEAIENIGAGWRARETYEKTSADEFTETFDLAPPGQDFSVYSKVVLKRVK